ncbi:uncharacterized protein MONOS_15372 [Monocercomonoides exilis]|uniref:uncharacterized protein n=1 Tax=Monocercomonoides exilis TaxID=2049356 RepID=UPI00355A2C88|nr:hypothetical protein MONOS_15372 [Monocercomonoides exilis]|eukprot:MONOS_15372.1-p1 / transcript=MONOS_15372.1 / gene=MONOS_15372 / organism=Monocercomonoides_exilis_PA203 / gene_product=unspecified product / transcript_product=unspecified product / location=Mono_scaffold01211:12823-13359(+) / protein_length=179 / sequence_SO=supercontig / SO=protein_coding / is_pseudo=false
MTVNDREKSEGSAEEGAVQLNQSLSLIQKDNLSSTRASHWQASAAGQNASTSTSVTCLPTSDEELHPFFTRPFKMEEKSHSRIRKEKEEKRKELEQKWSKKARKEEKEKENMSAAEVSEAKNSADIQMHIKRMREAYLMRHQGLMKQKHPAPTTLSQAAPSNSMSFSLDGTSGSTSSE